MDSLTAEPADLTSIGLPLLGRLLSLFLCGCSAVLAASYYILHAHRDPIWLVTTATLSLVLLLYTAALMMEVTWQSQMLPLEVYRTRVMWEYVAVQPARTLLPALAQGYLIKRYYGLSRGETKHRLAALTFTSGLVTEQALYMCVIILEVWQMTTPSAERHGAAFLSRAGLERRVYTSVFFIAACLDSSLATGFCLRMRNLRSRELDKGIDESLRFVMGVALATGFSTTFVTISTAVWFRAEHSESFRLLVNFCPPMYAASLYLALLSRERVRTRIERSQSERLEAAVANLEHIHDTEGDDDEVSLRAMFAMGPPEALREGPGEKDGGEVPMTVDADADADASTSASCSEVGADLCVCKDQREHTGFGIDNTLGYSATGMLDASLDLRTVLGHGAGSSSGARGMTSVSCGKSVV